MWETFNECYEARRKKGEIRGTRSKENLALAHAIHLVLSKEKIPRPIKYIASLCQVPTSDYKKLLNIADCLSINGKREVYQESPPEDYVHTLCQYLQIPFSVAQQSERVLQRDEIKFGMCGRRPQNLAAAAVVRVMQVRGLPSRLLDICEAMDTSQGQISQIAYRISSEFCLT